MTQTVTNPAPSFDCSACGRRIGENENHYLLKGGTILCGGRHCTGTGTVLHARFYPGCAHPGHDAFDHLDCVGDRRSVAVRLGRWSPYGGTGEARFVIRNAQGRPVIIAHRDGDLMTIMVMAGEGAMIASEDAVAFADWLTEPG